jgi:threonine/homoserine/homoserine lactone efflux protein
MSRGIQTAMELESLIGFASISFLLAISPGPSWAYVLSAATARESSVSSSAAAILGNAIGIMGHIVLACSGIALLLQYSSTLFLTVKLLGACYLIYLGIRLICSSQKPDATTQSRVSFAKTVRGGVMVNLLNPKVSILMLALLPQFVDANSSGVSVALQTICYGAIHVVLASIVLSSLASVVILSRRRRPARLGRDSKWLRSLAGGCLVLLGLKLVLSK